MASKTPTGRASKGSVSVILSNRRLQLRFHFSGKRYYISTGYPDTPHHRKLAKLKASEIEKDIFGDGKIVPISIRDEMKRSYIDYAMSVIVGRALPDVRDGLKPVHRRVLYAMDILINFRVGYVDPKSGILITDGKMISRHYLRGWFHFDLFVPADNKMSRRSSVDLHIYNYSLSWNSLDLKC